METIVALKALLIISGALVITFLTGCGAAGYKLGGEVGIYRVDAQQTSNRTVREQTGLPWYCDFITCKEEAHAS